MWLEIFLAADFLDISAAQEISIPYKGLPWKSWQLAGSSSFSRGVALGSVGAWQNWATLPQFKVFYCHVFTTEAPRTASLSLTGGRGHSPGRNQGWGGISRWNWICKHGVCRFAKWRIQLSESCCLWSFCGGFEDLQRQFWRLWSCKECKRCISLPVGPGDKRLYILSVYHGGRECRCPKCSWYPRMQFGRALEKNRDPEVSDHVISKVIGEKIGSLGLHVATAVKPVIKRIDNELRNDQEKK